MALKIGEAQLWSCRIDDQAGGAAGALRPLADAKANLEFVLARRTPEDPGRGILFVAPVRGAAAEQAAGAAGFAPASDIYALRVEGDDRAGAGHRLANAIAGAGVSFRGLSASVFGNKYVCYVALDTPGDAQRTAEALRALAPAPAPKARKARPRKAKAGKGKKRRK